MLGSGKLLGFVHQHGWVHWQTYTKKSIQVKSVVEQGRRNLTLEVC